MELLEHNLATLFEQLGLASDEDSINRFITEHGPLANDVKVSEADFWTPQQRSFLKGELREDADWALAIDELNVRLHESPDTTISR